MREPSVVRWYRIYCWALAVLYFLAVNAGLFFLLMPADEEFPSWMKTLYGILLMGVGVGCLALAVVGARVPPKRWGWTFGLVMICFGLTSCLTLPASIALLIHWLKPEAKAYFEEGSGSIEHRA